MGRVKTGSVIPAPFRTGGVGNVALPVAPAVPGDLVMGNPILLCENQCDDENGGPFDVVLAIPQRPNFLPDQPWSDLVAVIDFGQSRGNAQEQTGATSTTPGRILEVDWNHGGVISVPGSAVRVSARWDRYSAGKFTPPPIIVSAFLVPYGSAHSLNARRTSHHFAALGVGVTTGVVPGPGGIPGFVRSFILTAGGGVWQVTQITRSGEVLSINNFVAGSSPEILMVNGCEQINVMNAGILPWPFHLVFNLSL